jgi:HrpA-like RNA helicase
VDKVAAQGQGKPKFLVDAQKLLVQCVEALAAPDTTILVFLPGIDEICEVQEEIEKRAVLNVSVHVLHSQVEQEDQDLAIAPPPPDICKIILSTNIAESSITIPNVEVVIDSGLVRGIFYDSHRQIQCLLCKWCSRASVTQRAGRTGRLKDGICIHLMTAAFHDRLSPFDEPEILRTPLTKTILNVKLLFQAFGAPSQILGQFIDPPPLSSVRIAIEELYKAGATTGNSEDAAVTYLGKAATELPVDLPLCKLLLLGSAMAATNACCIMSAALALPFDVFALPMALFMRNGTDFASELASNFSSRVKFDEGQYSQPLMYLNVYKAWLASSRDHLWCKRNKLNFPRMRQFDHLVVTLAGRMRPLLQQHGLIPDLIDKLEAAAGSKSPLTEKEAEVITQGR